MNQYPGNDESEFEALMLDALGGHFVNVAIDESQMDEALKEELAEVRYIFELLQPLAANDPCIKLVLNMEECADERLGDVQQFAIEHFYDGKYPDQETDYAFTVKSCQAVVVYATKTANLCHLYKIQDGFISTDEVIDLQMEIATSQYLSKDAKDRFMSIITIDLSLPGIDVHDDEAYRTAYGQYRGRVMEAQATLEEREEKVARFNNAFDFIDFAEYRNIDEEDPAWRNIGEEVARYMARGDEMAEDEMQAHFNFLFLVTTESRDSLKLDENDLVEIINLVKDGDEN